MPYEAQVYRVLIASPGDVAHERDLITQRIHAWNNLNSEAHSAVLLPVRWETHVRPGMEGRPQQMINNQIVESADILIGVFWTKFGSDTGTDESGTLEEIKQFISNEKPTLLYFSRRPVDMYETDQDQFNKVKEYQKELREKRVGIYSEFTDDVSLNEKITRDISRLLQEILQKALKNRPPPEEIPTNKDTSVNLTEKVSFSTPQEHDKALFIRLNDIMPEDELTEALSSIGNHYHYFNSESNMLSRFTSESSKDGNRFIDANLDKHHLDLALAINKLKNFMGLNFWPDDNYNKNSMNNDFRFVFHPEKNPDSGRGSAEDHEFFFSKGSELESIVDDIENKYSKYRRIIKIHLMI